MHPAQYRKLNASEAAEYLQISASTLAKLRVYGGGPPFYKFGRRVLYDLEDIERWAAEHRRTSTSDSGAMLLANPAGRSQRTK